jgi:hypothetical protein
LIPETLVTRAFEALRGNFCQSTSLKAQTEKLHEGQSVIDLIFQFFIADVIEPI